MPGKVMRRVLSGAVATLIAIPTLTLTGASPASAVCQSTSVAAELVVVASSGESSETRRYVCSGTFWVNATATLLYAGGWSGHIYTRDVGTIAFCNGENIRFANRYIWTVILEPTRIPGC